MSFELLCICSLVMALIPTSVFLLNSRLYRRLPVGEETPSHGQGQEDGERPAVSVLIPARDEEGNIRSTLDAVLASRDCDFEVIVLDDHSVDGTGRIVNEMAARDPRVRLEVAPPLPEGWCGKQHACHALSKLARHPVLVFMDADVRLAPDALVRMSTFVKRNGLALASGVPRQETGTFMESLLLPLIHFIMLSFLSLYVMRRTRWPSMSAGCGQLFITTCDAYVQCGGHSRLRNSLHDGIKLPRVFRAAGFATELFDATDIATCRMYQTNGDTLRGLGKNAVEGLAAPRIILPMTLMLLGGQVLPCLLLAASLDSSLEGVWIAAAAVVIMCAPRLIAAWKFHQPWLSAILHPLGIAVLLGIQWGALFRHFTGRPSEWKGRRYGVGEKLNESIEVT